MSKGLQLLADDGGGSAFLTPSTGIVLPPAQGSVPRMGGNGHAATKRRLLHSSPCSTDNDSKTICSSDQKLDENATTVSAAQLARRYTSHQQLMLMNSCTKGHLQSVEAQNQSGQTRTCQQCFVASDSWGSRINVSVEWVTFNVGMENLKKEKKRLKIGSILWTQPWCSQNLSWDVQTQHLRTCRHPHATRLLISLR